MPKNLNPAVQSGATAPIERAYLTPREAADFSGFSPKALEVMRSRGRGPRYLKPNGRNIRYAVIDLRLWLEAGEAQR